MLHSSQAVTVCGKLVFNALVITYVWKYCVEDADFRGVVARDKKAALNHHLQQPHRLHGDAFAPRVGAADDEHSLLAMQFHMLRMRLLASQPVGHLQQGVVGRQQVKSGFLPNLRQAAFEFGGQPGSRGDPIEFCQPALVALDLRQVPADVARQHAQDVPNFLAFIVLEHLQLVVEGDAGAWLDECD